MESEMKVFFRRAAIVAACDFVAVATLWIAAGHRDEQAYLKDSVTQYTFRDSLLDLVLISLLRCLASISLYANIPTVFSPTSSWRKLLQMLAVCVPLSSIAFLILKLSLGHFSSSTTSSSGSFGFEVALIVVSFIASLADLILFFVTRSAFMKWSISDVELHRLVRDSEDTSNDERQDEETGDGNAKPKKRHSSIGRVLSLALPEKWLLLWGMIALLVGSLADLAMPYYFGQILQAVTLISTDSKANLTSAVTSLTFIFLVGSVADFVRSWLLTLAGQRLVARLRKEVFKAISIQEVAFFDATRTGELTNRLSSDTAVLQNSITDNISTTLQYSVQIVGAIVLLFVTSARLTLIMISVVPIVTIGAVFYGRYLEKLGTEFQDELAKASATAEECISNMRTVRSFSREKHAQEQYDVKVERSFAVGRKNAIATGGFTGALTFITQGAIALVVYEGGIEVIKGQMTVGSLTSFLLYTLTIAMAVGSFAAIFGDLSTTVGASERIFELLDKQPDIPVESGEKLEVVEGVLELKDVTFRYPTRLDSLILDNISLSLSPGSVVALVGPSGGGKSTIVSLIERFYDPLQGDVLLDGVNIKTLDPIWYRRRIGFVSQEPILFACSIRENIAYGVDGATQEDVENAAKQANAHDFIMNFPDKYDTVVGERGVRLSGGQKQRIAIARALLMNPKILLLDEATSALDAESEHLVQEAIDRAMLNRTVLIVAHRLSTVRTANKVVVISGGGITESGTHEELLAAGGIYKKLVKRQLNSDTND
eukprot:TRINITY_DN7491_c0_g1_i1.p1 TRINITY_DN7491_c0_g1~~TRINITY_DN7491_c0_g1_i1.p1  ORF type:complete len:771 (+),score=133.32 TRINITY_DN7491_c0_g1_i1:235-2547(+)